MFVCAFVCVYGYTCALDRKSKIVRKRERQKRGERDISPSVPSHEHFEPKSEHFLIFDWMSRGWRIICP